MRPSLGRSPALVLLMIALATTVALLRSGPPAPTFGAASDPSRASLPHPLATPIIEPVPTLGPAFLPMAMRAHDTRLPEPLGSEIRGYLHALREPGRGLCAPATHVLLDRREGVGGAHAWAVLRSGRREVNLDLYAGQFVEVVGPTDLAPGECRILTDWLVNVMTVRIIEVPPGVAP